MNELAMRQAIVDEAMTWLTTPYHHQGGIKGAGVDCAQILIEVYAAVGLAEKPDVGYYPSDWMLHRSEERYLGWVERYCREVQTPAMGDIVLFRFGRCFSHSGIVLDYPRIIHAQREDGCCYADATQGALTGREVRFYSFFPSPPLPLAGQAATGQLAGVVDHLVVPSEGRGEGGGL